MNDTHPLAAKLKKLDATFNSVSTNGIVRG